MQKEGLNELVNSMKKICKKMEKYLPYCEIIKVKKFVRSAHIILPKKMIGKKVLVIDLEELKEKKKKPLNLTPSF